MNLHPSTAERALDDEILLAAVEVSAPCRLHFGLLGWGQPDAPEYGGVGLMLAEPRVELRCTPAGSFEAVGVYAQRVREFAQRWTKAEGRDELPACRLEALAAPSEHSGLGLGTALGLSVAAAITAAQGKPLPAAAELAASVGRGQRSAVGTHGFLRGGFIYEAGKSGSDRLGRLIARREFPAEWRVVLARPRREGGVAGAAEEQAFARLPAVPREVTTGLVAAIEGHLLPALDDGDFDSFSECLYRYGRAAGECFAAAQGGAYAGPQVARLVAWLREQGVAGVGQSSWGPTVFALARNAAEAEKIAEILRERSPVVLAEVQITRSDSTGADVRRQA